MAPGVPPARYRLSQIQARKSRKVRWIRTSIPEIEAIFSDQRTDDRILAPGEHGSKENSLLSRNWWRKQLSGNELEVEGMGFLFEPFNTLEAELPLIVFDAFFDVILSVAQHSIDQASQMMSHGHDGFGSSQPCS